VSRSRFQYRPPDFDAPPLAGAPDARFEPAPADGVLPDGFFSTTNLPTYVRAAGAWRRPRLPRMDCVIVLHPTGDLVTTEPRKVRKGQPVAVGTEEDGSQGILVHAEGFLGGSHSANEFGFMQTEVSRERPVDYAVLAQLLGEEKQRGGKIVWVVGPALVHARARQDMIWFIRNGYVGALLGGNAVAVHDLEAAIFGTTLGMSSSGEGVEGGHALHMRAINAVRRAGGIRPAVEQGIVRSGIMHAVVGCGGPFVLAGSIADGAPPLTVRVWAAGTSGPGEGRGWAQRAVAVAAGGPRAAIGTVYLFRPLRVEGRAWGTAVIARRAPDAGGRLRVYTARYMLVVRGKERGQSRVELEETGLSPAEVIARVIQAAAERTGDAEPPVAVGPATWYAG